MADLTVTKLVELAKSLPGLTHRQAERLVFGLLSDEKSKAAFAQFADSLQNVTRCERCGWFIPNGKPCDNCATQESVICVVPTFSDMLTIKRSGGFSGSFHILGGLVSPLENILPGQLLIEALATRATHPEVQEIILAFPDSVEAEATIHYITDAIQRDDIVVSRFSRGIPAGSKLEHMDRRTLSLAFSERKTIDR